MLKCDPTMKTKQVSQIMNIGLRPLFTNSIIVAITPEVGSTFDSLKRAGRTELQGKESTPEIQSCLVAGSYSRQAVPIMIQGTE
jgi:hypothetical protein